MIRLNARRLLLLVSFAAACSAGAESGTGAPNGTTAGTNGTGKDAGKTGTGVIEEDDAGATGTTDAGKKDSGGGTDSGSTATDSGAGGDSSTASDGGGDSGAGGSDAGADAAKDSGADAAKDSGPDAAATVCAIDDATWVPVLKQFDVVAKGKLWEVSADGQTLIASTALTAIPAINAGPCAGQVGTCHLDAFTARDDLTPKQHHIVHGGNLYFIDSLTGASVKTAVSLVSLPGIAAGPCAGKTAAQCRFEAGAWRSDLSRYDLVADGKVWRVQEDGTVDGSQLISSLAAAVAGPCAGQVGTCHVDAFTYRPLTAGINTEDEILVVAKGNLYVMDKAGATLKSTTSLMAMPAMANGPCK